MRTTSNECYANELVDTRPLLAGNDGHNYMCTYAVCGMQLVARQSHISLPLILLRDTLSVLRVDLIYQRTTESVHG